MPNEEDSGRIAGGISVGQAEERDEQYRRNQAESTRRVFGPVAKREYGPREVVTSGRAKPEGPLKVLHDIGSTLEEEKRRVKAIRIKSSVFESLREEMNARGIGGYATDDRLYLMPVVLDESLSSPGWQLEYSEAAPEKIQTEYQGCQSQLCRIRKGGK